jgi:transcriptional regulator with PAS, ATPase and Fis domain
LVKVPNHLWVEGFPGAITVCDSEGIILEMNVKAVENFRQEGGRKLIGTNVLDCHPEPARTRLKQLMEKRQVNVYTTEKEGVRKLICQTPWYKAGEYRGFVELSLVIPGDIPNLIRDP